jgi:hypothetical protein
MGLLENIKDAVIWDINLEEEFNNRTVGYGFVIDVCNGLPSLALYRMKRRVSNSTTMQQEQQPPRELLLKALQDQGLTKPKDNIYPITDEVRKWIEDNLF